LIYIHSDIPDHHSIHSFHAFIGWGNRLSM